MASLFVFLDYVIVFAVATLALAIGLYRGLIYGRPCTPDEYLLGDGQLGVFPVSVSLAVSFLTPMTVLLFSSDIYFSGTSLWFFLPGAVVGLLFAGMFVLPVFHPLQMTSINEYLEDRFHSAFVKAIGWLCQVFFSLLVASVVLVVLAVNIQTLIGIPMWLTVLLAGLTASVYTVLGGLKAVVWADVFQATVLVTGLSVAVTRGVFLIGGMSDTLAYYNMGNQSAVNFSFSPFARQTAWGALVKGVLATAVSFTSLQAAAQRYSALPNLSTAINATVRAGVLYLCVIALCLLCGMTALAVFAKQRCDPLSAGLIQVPSQIMPFFVVNALNFPGGTGIFCACLLAASLSNVSTALNGITAVTWTDWFAARFEHYEENEQINFLYTMTIVGGLLSVLSGCIISVVNISVIELLLPVAEGLAGAVLLTIITGAFLPKISFKSVLIGIIIVMTVTSFIGIGRKLFTHQTYSTNGDVSGCLVRSQTSPAMFNANITTTISPEFTSDNSQSEDISLNDSRLEDMFTPRAVMSHTSNSSEMLSSGGWTTLFQVSQNWDLPIALLLGLLFSFVMSKVPGCQTKRVELSPKCYAVCIRSRTIKAHGYKAQYKTISTQEMGDFYLRDY